MTVESPFRSVAPHICEGTVGPHSTVTVGKLEPMEPKSSSTLRYRVSLRIFQQDIPRRNPLVDGEFSGPPFYSLTNIHKSVSIKHQKTSGETSIPTSTNDFSDVKLPGPLQVKDFNEEILINLEENVVTIVMNLWMSCSSELSVVTAIRERVTFVASESLMDRNIYRTYHVKICKSGLWTTIEANGNSDDPIDRLTLSDPLSKSRQDLMEYVFWTQLLKEAYYQARRSKAIPNNPKEIKYALLDIIGSPCLTYEFRDKITCDDIIQRKLWAKFCKYRGFPMITVVSSAYTAVKLQTAHKTTDRSIDAFITDSILKPSDVFSVLDFSEPNEDGRRFVLLKKSTIEQSMVVITLEEWLLYFSECWLFFPNPSPRNDQLKWVEYRQRQRILFSNHIHRNSSSLKNISWKISECSWCVFKIPKQRGNKRLNSRVFIGVHQDDELDCIDLNCIILKKHRDGEFSFVTSSKLLPLRDQFIELKLSEPGVYCVVPYSSGFFYSLNRSYSTNKLFSDAYLTERTSNSAISYTDRLKSEGIFTDNVNAFSPVASYLLDNIFDELDPLMTEVLDLNGLNLFVKFVCSDEQVKVSKHSFEKLLTRFAPPGCRGLPRACFKTAQLEKYKAEGRKFVSVMEELFARDMESWEKNKGFKNSCSFVLSVHSDLYLHVNTAPMDVQLCEKAFVQAVKQNGTLHSYYGGLAQVYSWSSGNSERNGVSVVILAVNNSSSSDLLLEMLCGDNFVGQGIQ